jgi:hypothetical protein
MKDSELIKRLGGPAKLARLLGYDGDDGTRRVFNWIRRGIPAKVRLQNQHIFDKCLVKKTDENEIDERDSINRRTHTRRRWYRRRAERRDGDRRK